MAEAQLSVEITAQIDGLRDAFNKARGQIGTFDKDTRKALGDIDKGFANLANNVDKSLNKAGASASKFSNASNSVSKALANQAVASSRATNAMVDVGRVLQDIPYGIQGAANNINPLVESFGRLVKESGSAKEALKTLASSLIGAGGLSLAFSLVTTGLLLYSQYTQKAARDAEAQAKEVEKQKNALNDFIEALGGVQKAQVKGEVSAQKELLSLRQLYNATQNLSLPMKERIRAGQALLDQYPETFKAFTAEQIALGQASTAYQQLASDIISVAQAQARLDIAVENESKKIKAQTRLIKVQSELRQQNAKLEATASFDPRTGDRVYDQSILRNILKLQTEEKDLALVVLRASKENLDLQKTTTSEMVTQKSVSSIVAGNQKKGREEVDKTAEILKNLRTELGFKGALQTDFEKTVSDIEAYDTAIKALIREGVNPASERIANMRNEQNMLIESLKQLGSLTKAVTPDLGGDITRAQPNLSLGSVVRTFSKGGKINAGLTEYDKIAKAATDSTLKFEESLLNLAESSAIASLSNAFLAIGESLAEGGNVLQAVGNALLQTLGNFLGQLGQMFIKEGIAQILYGTAKNIILPGSGANNISGGIGMIAAGALITAGGGLVGGLGSKRGQSRDGDSKPVRGFAAGGYNLPAGVALVGERGPELVNLPTGADVYNNNRSMDMLRGFNGTKREVVYIEGRVSNTDLYLGVKRGEQQYNR